MPGSRGAGTAPRRILIATPGFERALVAELQARPGDPQQVDSNPRDAADRIATVPEGPPGIVEMAEPAPLDPPLDPVFARQQLPAAVVCQGSSVATLAESCYDAVEAAVDAAAGPFAIHAFAPTGAEPSLAGRAELIASELLVRLRQRRRRAARWYVDVAPDQAALAFAQIRLLIQILLIERDRGWVSAARPRPLLGGGWDVAPWPAGVATVVEDRQPPSRAYQKLEEAFLWMAMEPGPGELCVDLGGAPGGWTYTALRRGARVIAVDRAPLAPLVRAHPHLTMIAGNAFTYEPPPSRTPVDWLLSDVICEPARALAQLERWLAAGWCRRLVMTVKFKGQTGYRMLDDVRAALARAGCPRMRIKHLHHNKNEVTVMAETPVAAARPPAETLPRPRTRAHAEAKQRRPR